MQTLKAIVRCIECNNDFEAQEVFKSRVKVKDSNITATYSICKCGAINIVQMDNKETLLQLELMRSALRKVAIQKQNGLTPKTKDKKSFKKENDKLDKLRKELEPKLKDEIVKIDGKCVKLIKSNVVEVVV